MSKNSKTTSVQRKLDAVGGAIENIKKEFDKVVEFTAKTIVTLETQLDVATSSSSYPGMNFVTLRNALCTDLNANALAWTPDVLGTTGSGPWDANEFDEFLVTRGFEPVALPHDSIDGVVIGAEGWSEEELAEQIYDRDASSLKIYTQELFVMGLILGDDPYKLMEQDAIDEVGYAHPGIQFILNQNFVWPWKSVGEVNVAENWDFDETDWAHESALKLLGYSASAQGPSELERRRILRVAFEASRLDGVETNAQRQRWGAARSARRLHAISHFLGWLVNLQGGEKPAAKDKWISDLDWLKKNFYEKTMRFVWPTTEGRKSTLLDPEAAWPSDLRLNARTVSLPKPSLNHSHTVSTSINLYRPSPGLAKITGPDAVSVAGAVNLIRRYIEDRNLQDPITRIVRTDQLLFALFGKTVLSDHELSSVARLHLS